MSERLDDWHVVTEIDLDAPEGSDMRCYIYPAAMPGCGAPGPTPEAARSLLASIFPQVVRSLVQRGVALLPDGPEKVRVGNVTMAALCLLLLALPLAAQSPAGTWATQIERDVSLDVGQTVHVTEDGTILLRPDSTYVSRRKWTWEEDGQLVGAYAYAEGRWWVAGPTLCAKRNDRQTATCQPFAATPHTLRWGAFEFTVASAVEE